MLKKLEWTELSHHNNQGMAALQEFFVRLDELDKHAEQVGNPQIIAHRLLTVVEEMNEVLFERATYDYDYEKIPSTTNIRDVLNRIPEE